MSGLTRRRLLAAAGVSTAGALAGCSSSSADEPEGTVLGTISVENLDDEAHAIDVLVEFDGGIEHWSTHHLEPGEPGTALDRDWPTGPGEFGVTVRLDEDALTQVTPQTWNDPDCLNLTVLVDRSGDIRVLSDPDGGPCEAAAGDEE